MGSCDATWAMWGTIGDTVGGISNAITMVFVVLSFLWGRSEIRRWRAQHAEEVRADAARHIYRAAHEMLTEARLLRAASGPDGDDDRLREHGARLNGLAISLRGAAADSELIFGEAVKPTLLRVMNAIGRARDIADRRQHSESHEIDEELNNASTALIAVLRPYATLGLSGGKDDGI